MLIGDIQPTRGSVCVAGFDVGSPNGMTAARKNVGFCPQTDPLLDRMTGRETLSMFAKLRGLPSKLADAEVERLLKLLTLTPYADKTTDEYSGGNKRKLTLGIALIGDPDVLLIDEACSGLDPAAQRKIWDLITRIAEDRSVLLTTHSMDEAQALSSRTAIMVDGKLLCLGTLQHLKVRRGADGRYRSLSCFGFIAHEQCILSLLCVRDRPSTSMVIRSIYSSFRGCPTNRPTWSFARCSKSHCPVRCCWNATVDFCGLKCPISDRPGSDPCFEISRNSRVANESEELCIIIDLSKTIPFVSATWSRYF